MIGSELRRPFSTSRTPIFVFDPNAKAAAVSEVAYVSKEVERWDVDQRVGKRSGLDSEPIADAPTEPAEIPVAIQAEVSRIELL